LFEDGAGGDWRVRVITDVGFTDPHRALIL